MEAYIPTFHAICGYIVFVTGILQYARKKGGKNHRIVGRIYFYTWIPLILTGAYIGSMVVSLLGFFGFYFAISSIRYAMVRAVPNQLFDKIQHGLGLALGLCLAAFGIILFLKGSASFWIVALLFGVLFSALSFMDFRISVLNKTPSQRQLHKMGWFFEHYTRMTISFIAALTAFSSIQNITGIVVLNWILPSVVGTFAIIAFNRRYEKKFGFSNTKP